MVNEAVQVPPMSRRCCLVTLPNQSFRGFSLEEKPRRSAGTCETAFLRDISGCGFVEKVSLYLRYTLVEELGQGPMERSGSSHSKFQTGISIWKYIERLGSCLARLRLSSREGVAQ